MITIFTEGGIGDLIISLPLIQKIFEERNCQVILYTSFPEIAQYFLPWIKVNGNVSKGNELKKNLDFYITFTDMIFFVKKPFAILPNYLSPLYNTCKEISSQWQEFLTAHPHKANQMAHKALSLKQTRWTLPFYFLGLEYENFRWHQEVKEIHIPNKYITIHDGFDASNYYKFMRSSKSWSIDYWESFVKMFKERYPDIAVIQLGGVKHQKIKGVDINLAGLLSFENSLAYLKSSLLHIDGDSGLVHARRLFNLPSVVIFGPTNHNYFGYHENINLAPKFCGDCWWVNSNWMANCRDGYETPKCMDSILPIDVLEKIKELLK